MLILPLYLYVLITLLLIAALIVGGIANTLHTRLERHMPHHQRWECFWKEIVELVIWLFRHHPEHGTAVQLNSQVHSVNK